MASEVDRDKDLETSKKHFFNGFIHSKAPTFSMQDHNKHLTCTIYDHFLTYNPSDCSVKQ